MNTFTFGTKAETLQILYDNLLTGKIKKPYYFTIKEWESNKQAVLNKISSLSDSMVVVRSSCMAEDTESSSNAGKFSSVLQVNITDEKQILSAVDEVIASYGTNVDDTNQVLVQEQVQNISLCGVGFTRDLDTLAPYYILNYDDSGSSDAVTSGTGTNLKTWIRYRDKSNKHEDPQLTMVIQSIQEIEELFNSTKIDIEFAVDNDMQVWILQARPIVNSSQVTTDDNVRRYLHKVHKKIDKLNRPHVNILGKRTVLGVMPDWNPAEMIGVRPHKLALSLYKELITDRIWAYQRDNYGYRNLRSYPLLVSFLGCPYIDARVSFNSFIPKQLSDNTARKIADYYLEKLVENPESHDKVEFDIIVSCYHFDIERRVNEIQDELKLNEQEVTEFKTCLKELTNSVMSRDGLCKKDLEKIDTLKRRYREVTRSEMTPIEKIYWLIEDCKRYGTLPFAGIARAAFIAVQMMKSLVTAGAITGDEFEAFMNSLSTVSKDLSCTFSRIDTENDKAAFLAAYGHLRPGTYDILSNRYDESFDEYFGQSRQPDTAQSDSEEPFLFSPEAANNIQRLLMTNGIELSVNDFLEFVKMAIEGREYSKLVFTRNVSEVLSILKKLGSKYELSAEEMSHVDIMTILNLYATLDAHDLRDILISNITINKKAYEITNLIKLPPLIRDAEDIYGFFLDDGQPNFITTKRIEGEVVTEDDLLDKDLTNKVVFIPSADPGYDWIFSRHIGGLITMYGGANSHMAIRAAELGLPAVIGCGEKKFFTWHTYSHIEVDCANKLVRELVA